MNPPRGGSGRRAPPPIPQRTQRLRTRAVGHPRRGARGPPPGPPPPRPIGTGPNGVTSHAGVVVVGDGGGGGEGAPQSTSSLRASDPRNLSLSSSTGELISAPPGLSDPLPPRAPSGFFDPIKRDGPSESLIQQRDVLSRTPLLRNAPPRSPTGGAPPTPPAGFPPTRGGDGDVEHQRRKHRGSQSSILPNAKNAAWCSTGYTKPERNSIQLGTRALLSTANDGREDDDVEQQRPHHDEKIVARPHADTLYTPLPMPEGRDAATASQSLIATTGDGGGGGGPPPHAQSTIRRGGAAVYSEKPLIDTGIAEVLAIVDPRRRGGGGVGRDDDGDGDLDEDTEPNNRTSNAYDVFDLSAMSSMEKKPKRVVGMPTTYSPMPLTHQRMEDPLDGGARSGGEEDGPSFDVMYSTISERPKRTVVGIPTTYSAMPLQPLQSPDGQEQVRPRRSSSS